MFNRLKEKWNVGGMQLVLIFSTFALGGSACGYLGRQVMRFLPPAESWLRIPLYIIIITLLWPLCVLAVSLPLGQFSFFSGFLGKMARRIAGKKEFSPKKIPVRIAIFASGGGSNAQKLIAYFSDPDKKVEIALVVCNKPGAGVVAVAQKAGVPVLLIQKEPFFSAKSCVPELQAAHIDLIVLAGFLWKIPIALIKAWPQKIVNIHPALLPGHGGKGMYGHFVHEAVLAAGDAESGITIHLVDELYDHGRHLFQARCPVLPGDTPETLAARVLQLEHRHFAAVVEQLAKQQQQEKIS